jgi:hypothetical protein
MTSKTAAKNHIKLQIVKTLFFIFDRADLAEVRQTQNAFQYSLFLAWRKTARNKGFRFLKQLIQSGFIQFFQFCIREFGEQCLTACK